VNFGAPELQLGCVGHAAFKRAIQYEFNLLIVVEQE
jgi:hypothetical protein